MSPGLLWAWHSLVTAALLELCSGSSQLPVAPVSAFHRKRLVVMCRVSDLGHKIRQILVQTRHGQVFTGCSRVCQVTPCSPGPPLVLSGGNLASASSVNLLYVVLQAYLVRKLVASRGRIWQ